MLSRSGIARLEAWIGSAAEALRTAIINIENIFDPETVLLGGILPERSARRALPTHSAFAAIGRKPKESTRRNACSNPRLAP